MISINIKLTKVLKRSIKTVFIILNAHEFNSNYTYLHTNNTPFIKSKPNNYILELITYFTILQTMKKMTYYLYFLLVPTFGFSQNLIENGNAEISPFTENGWTQITGDWQQRTESPLPQDGLAYFFAGANSSAELFQDIDVSYNSTTIDGGNQYYTFSCYLHSWPQTPADEGRVIVDYIDTEGFVLETYDTGVNTTTDEWVLFSDTRLAPVGTRTIKITLISERNQGSNNDGYIDNIELTESDGLNTEQFAKDKFTLFPNPAERNIQILGLTKDLSYEIFNMVGKKVATGRTSKNNLINIESLTKGLYFIQTDTQTLKFIKK